jgi:hypothetical protein
MLDLIVLGQIPGTEIYIEFEIVAIFILVSILLISIYRLFMKTPFRHYKKLMQKILETSL